MPEPAKRDPDAPKQLVITIKDNEGNDWGILVADSKDFSTGSVGYFTSGKIKNPKNNIERYQCSLSFTLIGSKPGK